MSDPLTQKDIDSLLESSGGSTPGGSPPAEVLLYDFRRPRRIARERLGTIESIFGRFAISLQAMLSSRLRTPTDVSVTSVEQATFAEFVFSLPNPCAAFIFDLGGPSLGQGVMDFGNEFAYLLVDRLFGGPGEASSAGRPLTPLERLVVKGIADRALTLFAEAWQDDVQFSPQQTAFESTPELLGISNRDDHMVVANLETRGGGASGVLSVCLPLQALEDFLNEPTGRLRGPGQASVDRNTSRPLVEAVLRNARQRVIARLPCFRMSMSDVKKLAAGSVINTSLPADVRLEVHIGDRRRYMATPGRVRQNLGLTIVEPVTRAPRDEALVAPKGRLIS